MRLQRLDLLYYGHFTNRSIDLPRTGIDFHIVFGPNEAGKSTALRAIEDLLFGIPGQSPYNFLHSYTDMRIGAVLESGAETLPIVRRKGNRDTLLDADGLPIGGGEGALAPFLAGADRAFFERMFCLDHVRLERGGQDILEARDDVGQMLFSAGAGIAGLRTQLDALSNEADALWSPRRAQRRRFYQAHDSLKEAEAALRNQSLPASVWRQLKSDCEAAEAAFRTIDDAFRATAAERSRLGRIRRVFSDVRRKRELETAIEVQGEVIALPDDAREVFEKAQRQAAAASAHIDSLAAQLVQAQAELDALSYDKALVLRADDVQELHSKRIVIARERGDLPNRMAELEREQLEFVKLAGELGWTAGDAGGMIARIPARAKVTLVRALLSQQGELLAEVSAKSEELQEQEDSLARLQDALGALGDPIDASRLAAVIRVVREQGDIGGRAQLAEREFAEAERHTSRLLASLDPPVSGEAVVVAATGPDRTAVQSHDRRVQAWETAVEDNRRQIQATERALAKALRERELVRREGAVMTLDALEQARQRRNALWQFVKSRHIENEPIPAEALVAFASELDDLAAAFEPAMQQADRVADQRFEHAEAAAKDSVLSRTIESYREEIAQLKRDETSLGQEGGSLAAAWAALWTAAPFVPLAPVRMLAWLDVREQLLLAIEAREKAGTERNARREQEREAIEQLIAELTALAVDTSSLQSDTLAVILEVAADVQRKRDGQVQSKLQLEAQIKEAKAALARRRQQLLRAEKALSDWEEKWAASLSDLRLAGGLAPEAVSAQIDVIDLMREKEDRINDLQHNRIEKIKRDIAEFEDSVRAFVGQVAEELQAVPADEAVLEIEARFSEAKRLRDLGESKKKQIEDLEKRIEASNEERRRAGVSVRHLKEAANVKTEDTLNDAIEKSDALRNLQRELDATVVRLEKDSDGIAIAELEKDCAGADIDCVRAQEASLETALDDLRQQQTAAAEERATARRAFEAIGGDDAAAQAAAARQEALCDIRVIAESFVRVKTSAVLLQWAIDRYRRERQAPLLKRAGELFAIMTGNSFTGLRVAFDDSDRAQLTGVRPSGEVVSASGMSTGTADQLYLALRVASIEDYLGRADALPFVADDLFINFDNARAAAGFRLLEQLALKTQVLFFTHHQHLVDIAGDALGSSAHVVDLGSEAEAAA